MRKALKNYLFILLVVGVPFWATANEQPIKQAHRPPILTTTAIIEVYEGQDLRGLC